jgi:Ca2+:H+ antiporter
MSRWFYLLLLAVPATLLATPLHLNPTATFTLAALGLIPLAGLIGICTEALAERLGQRIGGLLTATFGNAAEIIIGLAGLAVGLPDVVRASIAGSIIGNVLLVLGSAMLVGGWRYGRQYFDARAAGQYAAMLALAVIGMAIPSLLAIVGEGSRPGTETVRGVGLHELSLAVAVVLLFCYIAYIAFSVFGVHAQPASEATGNRGEMAEEGIPARAATQTPREHAPSPVRDGTGDQDADGMRSQRQSALTVRVDGLAQVWRSTLWLPLVVLAGVTALTAVMSGALVGAIEPVAHQTGLNPFFVGLIIIPIVGNAAEHFTAVTSAAHDHTEISMAITAGSSIQIALLAAPILVLASPFLGAPLDLDFTLLEVAVFGLVAGLYALISLDGESTWLEGLLLCAFYLILAAGTFFTPSP